jgi:HlyD family secretion protein
MKTFLKKNIISVAIVGAIIISGVGAVWYLASNHAPSFNAMAATRGNVISSLNEPVTVAAENNANLSFQGSGAIAHVYVTEGQTVSAGTILADLSNGSLQASVQQANAALAAAQANLDQLQTGTRPEQLTIDQTAVTNAQSSVSADIGNAYTAADDAVHNQTDNLFSNAKTNSPTFLVPMSDSQALNNIQSDRLTIEGTLSNWYSALNASSSNVGSLATVTNAALGQIQSYLDSLALAVNDATPNGTMTTSVLAGYKVNVATARAEVGAAITTITNAESALSTAQNTLTLAQAGSTPQAIEAQQAGVAQAQAGLAAAQVALNNTSLVAPFAGTVQNLTAQIGQVVAPGVSVVSLVNNSGLKIQAYASEADVAKIADGDTGQVTLDAFGNGSPFPATVTTIDSAQTTVNGTPAYLVTLHFVNPEPSIKDGMTGNVQIILAEHDNVIEVPSNLVINNNNNYFVLVQTASGPVQKPVQIGLVGDNNMTEITSGISVGDQLTNF